MSTPIGSSGSSSTSGSAAGSALITSTGIGSGLNISAIVSSLTTAYGAAQTSQLTAQQTSLNAQVSAYGTFSSALDTLQATLTTLEDPTQLAGFDATVADKTIATASTTSGAAAGQYSLEVQEPRDRGDPHLAAGLEFECDRRHGDPDDRGRQRLHLDQHRLDQQHACPASPRRSIRPRTIPG